MSAVTDWSTDDFEDMAKRMRQLSDDGHCLADDWAEMATQAAANLAQRDALAQALRDLVENMETPRTIRGTSAWEHARAALAKVQK
jgi:hypothetical protein